MSIVPSNHPSESQLRDFSLGQVDDVQSDRIFNHLRECADCCSLLDGLNPRDDLLSRLQSVAVRDGTGPRDPDLARRMLEIERGEVRRSGPIPRRHAEDSADASEPARRVGEYQLLGEVGRGGMGVVYKARDGRLNRVVALKMVLTGEFASESQRLRFQLEAELAARIQHPNIVRVHEVGTHEGRPFLALEWVDGGTLAERIRGNPWHPREAARFVEILARAIDAAHALGVVHRDLKPANILLETARQADRAEEAPARRAAATGVGLDLNSVIPKIADFGLARPSGGSGCFTRTGFIVGTPSYMAPEQAAGDHALMGPPTDVYALGVILYELLTGTVPFNGKTPVELLGAIRTSEPKPPRRLRPRLSRDLEAIVQKCLEKEPARRYPAGAALAEDLRRFREGRPIGAHPVGAIGRASRWCRRHPSTSALLSSLAVVLICSFVLVTWKWLEAEDQRGIAQANERSALRQAYRGRIVAALAALQGHDVNEAARQLSACPEGLRDWEWRHLDSQLDESSFSFEPRRGEQLSPLISEEKSEILSVTNTHLRILDMEGREVRAIPNRSGFPWAQGVSSRRGLRFICRGGDERAVLDGDGNPLLSLPFRCVPTLSHDLEHLAVVTDPDVGDTSRAWIYNLAGRNRAVLAAGHADFIYKVAFSPAGDRFATASEDATARLWDRATGRELGVLRGHAVKVLSVAYSRDGARLVTASADGTVRQWDAATRLEVGLPYDRHTGEVYGAAYSPDGRWIASGGSDHTVRVWHAANRREIAVLHGHATPVRELAFSGDGRWLTTASEDGSLKTWDMDTRHQLPALRGHASYIYPVRFTPDGRWIVSGGWDSTVRLWDASTGFECGILRHPSRVLDLDIGPDGKWLVTGCGEDDRLRIWSTASGRLLKEIVGPGRWIISVSVSPDGSRVAAVDNLGNAGIYDVRSGGPIRPIPGGPHRRIAYDPTGRWLAVAGDPKLTVWDQREPGRSLELETRAISLAFGADGRVLMSAGRDRSISIWDLVAGRRRTILRGHTDDVYAVAIHPDGGRVATAGRDGTIRLWEAESGEEVARLKGHLNYIWSLAFSPDGETLASGSGDGTIRLWDTRPASQRHRAQREAEALRPRAETLVQELSRQEEGPDGVAEAIRGDETLEEPLRSSALAEILRQSTLPPAQPTRDGGPRG